MTQHDVDRELDEAIGRLMAGESLASIKQAYPEVAELAQTAYQLQALAPVPTPDLANGRRRFLTEAAQPTSHSASVFLLGRMWPRPALATILVALMVITGGAVAVTASGVLSDLFKRSTPTPTITITPTPSTVPATPLATPSLTPTRIAPTSTLTPTVPAGRLPLPTGLPPTQPSLSATGTLPALPSPLPTERPTRQPTVLPTMQPSLTPPPTGFPTQPPTIWPTPYPTRPPTRSPLPTHDPTHEPPPTPEATKWPPETPRPKMWPH